MASTTCPRCQAPLLPNATFCVQCGLALTAQPQPTNPPAPQTPYTPVNYPTPTTPFPQQPPAPPAYAPPPSAPFGQAAPPPPPTFQPYAPPTPPAAPYGSYGGYSGYNVPQPPVPPSSMPYPPTAQPYGQPYNPYSPPSTPLAYAPPTIQAAPVFNGLLGPDADPAQIQPSTWAQVFIIRNIGARYAVNRWFTAALGAVGAIVVGLVLTLFALTIWSAALTNIIDSTLSGSSVTSSIAEYARSILTPNLIQLFALEHHVPLTLTISGGAAGISTSGSITLFLPLFGLFAIPALALTFGGYIAASSSFSRAPRYSILRGALIAPFYAVLLAILTLFGSGSASFGAFGANASVTVTPSAGYALIFGFIWGALFGALGGWIHSSGRAFLSSALATLHTLMTLRSQRIAGALAGALAAYISGFLLSLAALLAALVYLETSSVANSVTSSAGLTPTTTTATNTPSLFSALTLLLLYAITIIPPAAVWIFSFAAGGALTVNATSSVSAAASTTNSIGLIGAQHSPSNGVFYLLLLIPAVSYFIGGRVAARVAKAAAPDAAAVAGALMALPLSLIMAFAASIVAISADVNIASVTANASVAVSIGGLFLATLIGGGAVGALGGMSLLTAPALGDLAHYLLTPFQLLGLAVRPLLDALTGRSPAQPSSRPLRWLYDAIVAALVLGIVVIIFDIVSGPLALALPYKVVTSIDEYSGALLVSLPIAFLLGALISLFTTPAPLPAVPSGVMNPPMAPMNPLMAPMNPPIAQPTQQPYPSYPSQPPAPTMEPPTYPSA